MKPLTDPQKSWLTLAVLWLVLLILAAQRPLAVPDEGRYGEIGRWMLLSGDWLTPRLNGIPFFHKPPYLYWLEAASLWAFGVNAWALRLVPALHAGLMLVALYLAARAVSTEVVARRAAVMLGTGLGFWIGGQYVNHDMLVAAWISVAIWCFAFALMVSPQPSPWLARLGFVACALGMLSKGLIGVVLPGGVILVWLIWTGRVQKLMQLPWISGLTLWGLVALPWFVLAQQTYPDFLNYMFVGQQFHRYTAAVYNNPQPWWFYGLALAVLLFPWFFLALGQVRRVTARTLTRSLVMDAVWWRLCWAWVLVILVFFSIPHSKLIGYILPVLPPLALLAALGWDRIVAQHTQYPWADRVFWGVCGLNLCLAVALVTMVGGVTRFGRTQDVARVLACAARPDDTVYVLGAYPYDLPFYARTTQPLVVVADWPTLRRQAGDGWQRELFEGADFDPAAARVLQPVPTLAQAGTVPGGWLVMPTSRQTGQASGVSGWTVFYQGAGWTLYRSAADAGQMVRDRCLSR